jgi:hypothetical protein
MRGSPATRRLAALRAFEGESLPHGRTDAALDGQASDQPSKAREIHDCSCDHHQCEQQDATGGIGVSSSTQRERRHDRYAGGASNCLPRTATEQVSFTTFEHVHSKHRVARRWCVMPQRGGDPFVNMRHD